MAEIACVKTQTFGGPILSIKNLEFFKTSNSDSLLEKTELFTNRVSQWKALKKFRVP